MSLLADLTLPAILSRIFATLVFVAVSGGVLALMSHLLRLPGAERGASVSANPFVNLSLAGLAMGILFRTTWMRFRSISPAGLRGGRIALVGLAFATLLAGLALVPLLDLLRPLVANGLPRTIGYAALQAIDATQRIALSSVPLNLLPLPGLTGGLLLLAAFPDREKRIRKAVLPMQAVVIVLLVAGLWPDFGSMLAPYLMRG